MKNNQISPVISRKAEQLIDRHGKHDAIKNAEQLIYLSVYKEDREFWTEVKNLIELSDDPKGFCLES